MKALGNQASTTVFPFESESEWVLPSDPGSVKGGAIPNLMVCTTGSAQTVPAGSIFHYQLIGP